MNAMIEAMEDRTLCSASIFANESQSLWDSAVTAVPAATVMVPAATRSAMVSVKSARTPPVVTGNWSGTVKSATTRAVTSVTFTITRQRGAGATGTFSMGPVTAGTSLVSTAIVGTDRSFKIILQGNKFYGSIVATVSANGKQIVGRWSCNNGGAWQVGTLTLNKA